MPALCARAGMDFSKIRVKLAKNQPFVRVYLDPKKGANSTPFTPFTPFTTIQTIQDEKFDEMGKGSHMNKVLTSKQSFKAIQEDHSRPFKAIQGHSRSFEAIQNHSAQFIAIQSHSGAF